MTITEHPRAYATVTGGDAIYTGTDGHRERVIGSTDDIRLAVVRRAADDARRAGAPVELVTRGDRGDHHLLVGHDGNLTPLAPDGAQPNPEVPHSGEAELPDTAVTAVPDSDVRCLPEATRGASARGARRRSVPAALEREASVQAASVDPSPAARASFITPQGTALDVLSGWRGLLARLGIRVGPSPYELARADWVEAVSRQWAGCRTIAVVNGKGGVGKTMTSAMLAAVYARNGGGNVLAWDNNDTRGTLGWRTEAGLYDTTIRDLLPAARNLLAATASVSDITRFVHHQGADRYDVLRSNPELLATDQRLDGTQFDLLMQVAARYYRLVVFDSGNDESADRWIRMIDSTRQLVIPTLATPESAESASLLLEALRHRDDASAALAANAVIVVTQAEPGDASAVRRIAAGFDGWVRAVETVPFDPALKSGALRLDQLRPVTRDAWLRVAASAAEGL